MNRFILNVFLWGVCLPLALFVLGVAIATQPILTAIVIGIGTGLWKWYQSGQDRTGETNDAKMQPLWD